MSYLRIALRIPLLALWTAVMYAILVVTTPLLSVLRRQPGMYRSATGPWRTRLFHVWSRGLLPLLGIRAEFRGRPPRPPFFLVTNHLGYLDVIVLASQARCVFVSKADVAEWPVFGSLCRAADTLFIDRGNKRDIPRVIGRMEQILAGERGVVVFPEGSSTSGEGVLRFRPSLLESAASARLPVSYAALSYGTPPGCPPARMAVCWWGDMPFGSHLLRLLGLRQIQATLSFGEQPIIEDDRKALASRLQQAVERQLNPVV